MSNTDNYIYCEENYILSGSSSDSLYPVTLEIAYFKYIFMVSELMHRITLESALTCDVQIIEGRTVIHKQIMNFKRTGKRRVYEHGSSSVILQEVLTKFKYYA
jgi:hypothetical protein